MKKMSYQNVMCEVEVVAGAAIRTAVPCAYGKSTIGYAVERFFARSRLFSRECTRECWEIRLAKGKARRAREFSYFVPAVLMELPGQWVHLAGTIDVVGVHIDRVELLKTHPCFALEE